MHSMRKRNAVGKAKPAYIVRDIAVDMFLIRKIISQHMGCVRGQQTGKNRRFGLATASQCSLQRTADVQRPEFLPVKRIARLFIGCGI